MPLLAFVVIAPVAAYSIHQLASGNACGWNYGAVGGACRFIILLSIAGGALAASFAAAGIQAMQRERRTRAIVFDMLAIAVFIGAVMYAREVEHYREAVMQIHDEHDARMRALDER